jgi:hypothetical protein
MPAVALNRFPSGPMCRQRRESKISAVRRAGAGCWVAAFGCCHNARPVKATTTRRKACIGCSRWELGTDLGKEMRGLVQVNRKGFSLTGGPIRRLRLTYSSAISSGESASAKPLRLDATLKEIGNMVFFTPEPGKYNSRRVHYWRLGRGAGISYFSGTCDGVSITSTPRTYPIGRTVQNSRLGTSAAVCSNVDSITSPRTRPELSKTGEPLSPPAP